MRLYTLHRFFIIVVLLFSALMVAYGFYGYFSRDDGGALGSGLAGLMCAVLGVYYRSWFVRKFKD